MKSIHQGKVIKAAFEFLWDTLPNRERDIIAADANSETKLAEWFRNTVTQTAQLNYESPTYCMNNPDSFKYENYE